MSRTSVQVVVRERTSTSPDCSAVKRSLADVGVYLTFSASPKMAAATARQMSTSSPVQLPLVSGLEKPGLPWLTPHWRNPFFLTSSSVPALATPTANPPTVSMTASVFMKRCMATSASESWER